MSEGVRNLGLGTRERPKGTHGLGYEEGKEAKDEACRNKYGCRTICISV